jgi:ABC-type bacteriocin/lantibiotic exporter with double-glycine peptidase domain
MSAKMPYYSQSRKYSCGAACLKMAFAAYGRRVSERDLIRATKTTKQGTTRKNMLKAARKSGFKSVSYENASILQAKRLAARGVPVIINYMEPTDYEDHFAVFVSVGRNFVVLNDPWNGRSFRISKKEFLKRWWGWTNDRERKIHRWIMSVRPRQAA